MSDQSPPRDETGMTWKDRLERGRSATVKGGVVGGRATGRALKVAMIETGKTLRLASKLIAIRVGEPEYHCSYEDWIARRAIAASQVRCATSRVGSASGSRAVG